MKVLMLYPKCTVWFYDENINGTTHSFNDI